MYVPIGLGSGVCGVIAARDALGCKARVIGVVSDRANTYRLSLDAGRCGADQFGADVRGRHGGAHSRRARRSPSCRPGMDRLIEVTDDEVAEAIRILYTDTHTLAEGAGAAAFAALMQERDAMRGKRVAVVVSGQNIDRPWMADRARRRHAAGRVRRCDAGVAGLLALAQPREIPRGRSRHTHARFDSFQTEQV